MELNQTCESRDRLRSDKKRLEKELTTKNEWIKTQEEVLLPLAELLISLNCLSVHLQEIGKHSASRQFLKTKVAELEKVREANNQEMNEKLVLSTYRHC